MSKISTRYDCWKCQAGHSTDNVVAVCVLCYDRCLKELIKKSDRVRELEKDMAIFVPKGIATTVADLYDQKEKAANRIKELEAAVSGRTVSCVCGGRK